MFQSSRWLNLLHGVGDKSYWLQQLGSHGDVYTMDHEVVSRPYKSCNWILNSFQDQFGLYQRKKGHSDREVRGSQ